MIESIHEFVVRRLESRNPPWREISEHTGMSIRTIEKVARRIVTDPRISTVETLYNYFRARKAS